MHIVAANKIDRSTYFHKTFLSSSFSSLVFVTSSSSSLVCYSTLAKSMEWKPFCWRKSKNKTKNVRLWLRTFCDLLQKIASELYHWNIILCVRVICLMNKTLNIRLFSSINLAHSPYDFSNQISCYISVNLIFRKLKKKTNSFSRRRSNRFASNNIKLKSFCRFCEKKMHSRPLSRYKLAVVTSIAYFKYNSVNVSMKFF